MIKVIDRKEFLENFPQIYAESPWSQRREMCIEISVIDEYFNLSHTALTCGMLELSNIMGVYGAFYEDFQKALEVIIKAVEKYVSALMIITTDEEVYRQIESELEGFGFSLVYTFLNENSYFENNIWVISWESS